MNKQKYKYVSKEELNEDLLRAYQHGNLDVI